MIAADEVPRARTSVVVLAWLVCAFVLCAPAQAQVPIRAPARMNPQIDSAAEAARVARHISGSSAFLDSALVDSVAHALATIRTAHPDLRRVWDDGQPYVLELTLAPELARRIKRHAVAVDSTTSPIYRVFDLPLDGARAPRTGIRALDSLGRALQVTDFSVRDMGNDDYTTVLVVFRYAMNLDRVGAGYETVPGVAYVRMAQMRLESYSGIRLRRIADGPSGSTWEFIFREGRGDCPSGCPSYPTPVEYNWRSGAITRHPEGEP